MAVDSSLIARALIAKLLADAPLMAICTDGIWMGVAKQGAQKFVIVDLVDHFDEPQFGGAAYESALFLVKAVAQGSSGADVDAAAARIHAVLEDQPLTAAGYTWMTTHRERHIRYPEIDEVDRNIRWQHAGGHYRIDMSLTA